MKRCLTTVSPLYRLTPPLLLAAWLMQAAAFAQETPSQTPPATEHQKKSSDGLGGFLILGAAAVPDYQGSKDYGPSPFIAGRLSYDNYYIDLKGPAAKVNVSPFSGFEFGPSVGLVPGRGKMSNDQVDAMRNIDYSIAGGGFVKISTRQMIDPTDELAFGVDALTDLGGKHEGTTITFGPSYSFSPLEKLRLGLDISATYASGAYTNTFFGVNAGDARRSGLSQYNAGGGIKDVGVTLNVTYQWAEHWAVTGFAGYARLVGDAANSPIVAKEGSANQAVVGTGIIYRF